MFNSRIYNNTLTNQGSYILIITKNLSIVEKKPQQ